MKAYDITIDGNDFSNMEEFYCYMDKILTKPVWRSGHNLDALNDLLRGGFGVSYIGSCPVHFKWVHSDKSRKELPSFDVIVSIFNTSYLIDLELL